MSSEQLGLVIEPKSEASGGKFYKALYDLLEPDGKDGELRLGVGGDGSVIFKRAGETVGLQILDTESKVVISAAPKEYRLGLITWDDDISERGLPTAMSLMREDFEGNFEDLGQAGFDEVIKSFRDSAMKFVRFDLTEGTLILDQGRTGVALAVKRDDVGGNVRVNWGLTWNGEALFWMD